MITIQPLLQALKYTAGFFVVHFIGERVFPVPKPLSEIKDEKKKSKEIANYYSTYPSILFGLTVTLWSLHSTMNHGTTYGQPTIPAFQGPMLMAYGYFIQEFLLAVLKQYADFNFFFHHIASLAYAALICHLGTNGSESVKAMLLCEATGPLYNLSVILKAYNKESLRNVVGVVFILIFFTLRIVPLYGVLVGYQVNTAPTNFIKIFPTIIWFISMSWVWDMLNKIFKAMGQAAPGNQLAQLPYKLIKKARKYKIVYLVLIGYISVHHWVVQFVSQGGASAAAGQVQN